MPALQQAYSVILSRIIHLQLHCELLNLYRSEMYVSSVKCSDLRQPIKIPSKKIPTISLYTHFLATFSNF